MNEDIKTAERIHRLLTRQIEVGNKPTGNRVLIFAPMSWTMCTDGQMVSQVMHGEHVATMTGPKRPESLEEYIFSGTQLNYSDNPPDPIPPEYLSGDKLWNSRDGSRGYRYNNEKKTWILVWEKGVRN